MPVSTNVEALKSSIADLTAAVSKLHEQLNTTAATRDAARSSSRNAFGFAISFALSTIHP